MVYEENKPMIIKSPLGKSLIEKHNLEFEYVEYGYWINTDQPNFDNFLEEYIELSTPTGFVYD
jgi:hypothetical protein